MTSPADVPPAITRLGGHTRVAFAAGGSGKVDGPYVELWTTRVGLVDETVAVSLSPARAKEIATALMTEANALLGDRLTPAQRDLLARAESRDPGLTTAETDRPQTPGRYALNDQGGLVCSLCHTPLDVPQEDE